MTITFIRTIILYLVVSIALRIMGKRQIGELSPNELVITLLFSELASLPMSSIETPLIYGVIPILTLLALEILISTLFLKSRWIRKIAVGKTSILIEDGKINQEEMKRLRLTLDEFLEELRLKGFIDISTVKYAILESSGELSVFPFGQDQNATRADLNKNNDNVFLPHTLISDGIFIESEAKKAGKNLKWVKKELKKQKIASVQDVFLMQTDDSGKTKTVVKEKKK